VFLLLRRRRALHNLAKHQSTNWAEGNALATILATGLTQGFISKSGDHSTEATVSKANGSFTQFFLAYPNASTAEHTFVGIIDEQGTAGIYGELRKDFSESFCLEFHAEMLGYPLKFAGTTFWTVGAIHGVAG